jgi:hypothetical protein
MAHGTVVGNRERRSVAELHLSPDGGVKGDLDVTYGRELADSPPEANEVNRLAAAE